MKEACVVDGKESEDGADANAQLLDSIHPDQRLSAMGTHDDTQLNVANDAPQKYPGSDL